MLNRILAPDRAYVRGADPTPDTTRATEGASDKEEFSALLAEADAKQVHFSNHAKKRIEQRQIDIRPDDLSLLSEGIERAERKGSRDALMLVDRTAYVVNVPSRTVVTAVDQDAMKDKAFTNIDSAILLLRGQ